MAILDFPVEPGPVIETRNDRNRSKPSSDVRAGKYYNFRLIIDSSRRNKEDIGDEDSTLELESNKVRGYMHSTIG